MDPPSAFDFDDWANETGLPQKAKKLLEEDGMTERNVLVNLGLKPTQHLKSMYKNDLKQRDLELMVDLLKDLASRSPTAIGKYNRVTEIINS